MFVFTDTDMVLATKIRVPSEIISRCHVPAKRHERCAMCVPLCWHYRSV